MNETNNIISDLHTKRRWLKKKKNNNNHNDSTRKNVSLHETGFLKFPRSRNPAISAEFILEIVRAWKPRTYAFSKFLFDNFIEKLSNTGAQYFENFTHIIIPWFPNRIPVDYYSFPIIM